jgi:MFS family permease
MHTAPTSRPRAATRHNLVAILRRPGFRKLLTTRILSQIADGWFQVGLAGSIFFNPERATDALAITAGFAVLLLPYSVLGPFVGVFLDRWSRRTSLGVANLARAAFVVPAAALVWWGTQNLLFVLAALCVIALNRFFLAGLSAAQPHVVDTERLVTANSFASTFGTICYITSLGTAGFVVQLAGPGAHNYALVSAVAVACYLASGALLLIWFRPDALGPDDAVRPTGSVVRGVADTVTGMVAGVQHLAQRPLAAVMLISQAGHRLLFGVLTLTTLLLYRNHYASGDPGASITGLIPVAIAAAVGSLVAAVATPPLVRRVGAAPWLIAYTAALAVLVPVLGLPYLPMLTVLAGLTVSLGAHATKIVTDTTIQLEMEDDYRGRVFSVNDTGFNLSYVLGLLLAALALPESGVSVPVMLATGAGYGLLALGFALANRRIRARRTASTLAGPRLETESTPA